MSPLNFAATVYVWLPVIGCAVKLMAELCLLTGLGKRKRVMDEKELMIPLELGYVQESEKKKALMKQFTSESVEFTLMTTSSQRHKCTTHTVFLNNTALFFILKIPRWRRETRIKSMAGKPQGEVAYYAPCGKKLRQYPDVMKVLRPHSAAV